ncbi:DNA polymerase alpha/epsilon subunit B-domain-containing protein [Phycomyces nitens]|nr:DNA polymerase alpha/epsilon subunit B-domain-containing protein [Phycomyces nitens]
MANSSLSMATSGTPIYRKLSTFDKPAEISKGFEINHRSFNRQYAEMYYPRLNQLRPILIKKAKEKWGTLPEKPFYVSKALEVLAGEFCYIVGTVYMEMTLKPNVLRDLNEESSLIDPNMPTKYRSDNDVIALEDESGRVELTGKILKSEQLVSGAVIAVLGKEAPSGAFEVFEICLPGVSPQKTLKPRPSHDQKYVAILSGLSMDKDGALDLNVQLLSEFLSGELGSVENQKDSACITRLIIAGNSVDKAKAVESGEKSIKYGYEATRYDSAAIDVLDSFLENVCSSLEVDLMPGPNDPTAIHLPQKPIHPFMFNKSKQLSTFNTVTNPYCCDIDGINFLGTSGQNVDDIYRYSNGENRLKLAELTMFWQHIAPTAPDTLWCYPLEGQDPFLVKQCPNVYFIGNQPEFETSEIQGNDGQKVRVILVPSFQQTGQIVLVNLETLEASTLGISGDLSL